MKPAAVCLIAFVSLAGCGHTHTTEKPTGGADAGTPPPAGEESPKPRPAHPAKTPVVEDPGSLLAPGGDEQIRTKLVDGGYLDDSHARSIEGALRKFQSAKDLPVTGIADHETVRRLGLDPSKIFRSAKPPQ